MIKKRAETFALEEGDKEVTIEHLATLSARRFGGNLPFSKPVKPIKPSVDQSNERD